MGLNGGINYLAISIDYQAFRFLLSPGITSAFLTLVGLGIRIP